MFNQLAAEYACICIARRNLRREMPQCVYFQQWKLDLQGLIDGFFDPCEIERPCYMQSVRTGVDRFDPLPIEERCEACQKRAELEPQIKALTAKMRGLKRRMLRAYENEIITR
jgi:hypothetical protein